MIQGGYDNQQGNASLKPSPLLWAGVPLLEMIHNPEIGHWDELPIRAFPAAGGSASTSTGIKIFAETGTTFVNRAKRGGEIRATFGATAQASAAFSMGGGDGLGFAYSLETDTDLGSRVKFETAIAVADVTTAGALTSFFLGLAGVGYVGDNGLADTGGAIGTPGAQDDVFGFHLAQGVSATAISFTYKKEGQTAVVPIASVATLAATAYVKLGFDYNPGANNPANICQIWVNGAPADGKIIPATALTNAAWPGPNRLLVPTYHGKLANVTGGSSNTHDIPFMRIAQW